MNIVDPQDLSQYEMDKRAQRYRNPDPKNGRFIAKRQLQNKGVSKNVEEYIKARDRQAAIEHLLLPIA